MSGVFVSIGTYETKAASASVIPGVSPSIIDGLLQKLLVLYAVQSETVSMNVAQ